MGTRLQCESYPLGHYSMGNTNDDSNSSWSNYYEDKTLDEHLCNGFKLESANGYPGYDKEMLKHTMLEHEAIFRKQVCELHRLYRTQKNLMEELKGQEPYEFHLQTRTTESYLFPSSVASETSKKLSKVSHQAAGGTSFHMDVVADADDAKPSLELLKKNCKWFSTNLTEDRVYINDSGLSDSVREHLPLHQEKLDLRLSADVYIDVNGSEVRERKNISKSTYDSSMIREVERESDVKLTLGSSEDIFCIKESWNSDSIQQNGRSIENFDYLSKPMKVLSSNRQAGSVSSQFYGTINCDETDSHQLPTRSDGSFLPRDFISNKQRDEGPCSGFSYSDKREAGEEWSPFSYNDGRIGNRVSSFDPGANNGRLVQLPDSVDLNVKSDHKNLSHDRSEMHSWLEEKSMLGVEPYHESSPLLASNYLALSNSEVPGPLSVIPCPEYTSNAYPLVLPPKKPRRVITYVPIAVQALPCFPASGPSSRGRKLKENVGNSSNAGNTLRSGDGLMSPIGVGVDLSSAQTYFHQNLCANSDSLSQFKHSSDNSVSENREACAYRKLSNSPNEVTFSESLPSGINGNEKLEESSEGFSWLRSIPPCDESQEGFSFLRSFNQTQGSLMSSCHVKESRKKGNGISRSGSSTSKVLGFSRTDRLPRRSTSMSSAYDIKRNCKNEVGPVTENSRGGLYISDFQDQINLNSLEISTEDDVPRTDRTAAPSVDLEVPTAFYETLDSFAAENLVAMSLNLTHHLASASSCDSLHWFADVVSSTIANADGNDNSGVDVFESLTLQLKEVRPDEYLLPSKDLDNEKDGNGFTLLTKTRRGQARKRRQLKDFQKDVLPVLVPLSRHELIEDFQAFECLMRAMGENWQCNLTTRSAGRKGSSCKGRGRRQPTSLAADVTETHLSPPPLQATANSDLEVGEKSIIRWGRTTRRGRRPRVKPATALVSCSRLLF